MTTTLARLDYRTPAAAQAAIANLIAAPAAARAETESQENSQPEEIPDVGDRDARAPDDAEVQGLPEGKGPVPGQAHR
jgi:hypothetical protein